MIENEAKLIFSYPKDVKDKGLGDLSTCLFFKKGNVDYLRGKVCNGKTITWVKIIGTAPH